MKNFVILTTQRSGSIWLMKLLDGHENIDIAGEVFKKNYRTIHKPERSYYYYRSNFPFVQKLMLGEGKKIESYLDEVFPQMQGVFGFKLMVDQMRTHLPLEEKLSRRGFKIIKLFRKNLLKKRISQITARKTKLYVLDREKVQLDTDQRLWLPTKDLVEQLDKLSAEQQTLKDAFSASNVYELSYEQLLANRDDVIDNILDFLELPAKRLHSTTEKINKSHIKDILTNYRQVEEALKGTKYADLLQD